MISKVDRHSRVRRSTISDRARAGLLAGALTAAALVGGCGSKTALTIEAERCDALDNDADGAIDEGCPCSLGRERSCYPGSAASRGVGACRDGAQRCEALADGGARWGRCRDAVVPAEERCETEGDLDCDGLTGCGDPDCGERLECICPGGTFDPIGCADGAREAYRDAVRYPSIAGCSGGWSEPGTYDSTEPACGRAAGDDADNPSGFGCRTADLCACGWHVCVSAQEVAENSIDGCAGATDAVGAFFATRQSGPGCGQCAVGTRAGCIGLSCEIGCAPNEMTTNDVYGCGTIGAEPSAGCAPLDRFSHDGCGALPAPWSCARGQDEARNVTKVGPDSGGVLCCRDSR